MAEQIPDDCARSLEALNELVGQMVCYTDQDKKVPLRILTLYLAGFGGLHHNCPRSLWSRDMYEMLRDRTTVGEDYDALMQEQPMDRMLDTMAVATEDSNLTRDDMPIIKNFTTILGAVLRANARGEEPFSRNPSRLKKVGNATKT